MTSPGKDILDRPPKTPNGEFPPALTIQPELEHKHTFIILHGRGSTAKIFAPPLLETTTPAGRTLQAMFPNARLTFLTASRNRAKIYKRAYTHQWFDQWHTDEPNTRQELMKPGLKKSCEYLHGILREEIQQIGAQNVVVWGLSQGCAMSLMALLTWDGEPFAAVVGMCGYLPFSNCVEEIVNCASSREGGQEDEVFESSSRERDLQRRAVAILRKEVDMEEKAVSGFQQVPIFLGHGTEDDKVPIEIGREAQKSLKLVGVEVHMAEYEGLGHWYCEEMLDHIFDFLKENLQLR